MKKGQAYYSNIMNVKKGVKIVETAVNGEFNNGFTVIPLHYLKNEVEGANLVLDKVLNKLLDYKNELEAGKMVNVFVTWTIDDDLKKYQSATVEKVEVNERL